MNTCNTTRVRIRNEENSSASLISRHTVKVMHIYTLVFVLHFFSSNIHVVNSSIVSLQSLWRMEVCHMSTYDMSEDVGYLLSRHMRLEGCVDATLNLSSSGKDSLNLQFLPFSCYTYYPQTYAELATSLRLSSIAEDEG